MRITFSQDKKNTQIILDDLDDGGLTRLDVTSFVSAVRITAEPNELPVVTLKIMPHRLVFEGHAKVLLTRLASLTRDERFKDRLARAESRRVARANRLAKTGVVPRPDKAERTSD